MFFTHFFLAIIISMVLTVVIAGICRGETRVSGLFFFFLILFLATWAGGVWITPFGPIILGVPWFGFFFFGLLIALILAVFTPSKRKSAKKSGQVSGGSDRTLAMDVFFWFLLLFLIIGIVMAYVR